MTTALIGFIALLILAFIGVPLGLASVIIGVAGFTYYRGFDAASTMVAQQFVDVATNQELVVIPLFILMGILIWKADISEDLFNAGSKWLGGLKGGVAMSTIAASGAFSAVCGSSLATTATMSKVAMPSLKKFGYSESLSTGTVAAGGTLGIMIPPSVPMIIFAIVAEEDVGKLFLSGIIPGLMLIVSYMLTIYLISILRPSSAPPGMKFSLSEKIQCILPVTPILGIFTIILGGIYAGIFTPTEAATVGVVSSLLYALVTKRITKLRIIVQCMIEATTTSASIFVVIIGSMVFASFINLTGMPQDMMFYIEEIELPTMWFVFSICIVFVILGTVFETIGILVLALPVFLPTLYSLDINMIWFGIVTIIVIEMGLISPPIGMNVFVVKTVMPEVKLRNIFKGVMPFIAADFIVLALLFIFPNIATFLI